ncbi:MAG: ribonuclease P protein component [Patescibacteria group bacterium]
MLKKSERVGRKDFSVFFKSGRRFQSPHTTIIYTPHPTLAGSVVVSKKVSNKAVERNKLRRRVYDALRQTLKTQKKTGVFIVVVKPSIRSLPRAEQRSHLLAQIGQVVKST